MQKGNADENDNSSVGGAAANAGGASNAVGEVVVNEDWSFQVEMTWTGSEKSVSPPRASVVTSNQGSKVMMVMTGRLVQLVGMRSRIAKWYQVCCSGKECLAPWVSVVGEDDLWLLCMLEWFKSKHSRRKVLSITLR